MSEDTATKFTLTFVTSPGYVQALVERLVEIHGQTLTLQSTPQEAGEHAARYGRLLTCRMAMTGDNEHDAAWLLLGLGIATMPGVEDFLFRAVNEMTPRAAAASCYRETVQRDGHCSCPKCSVGGIHPCECLKCAGNRPTVPPCVECSECEGYHHRVIGSDKCKHCLQRLPPE